MAKILMADDSSFMRKILINILTKNGYSEIIEVSNGEEAVEKYKAENPDLVLLDIVMDKMNGIDALKKIKEINSDAKVLMVSAVGQEQMVNDAKSAGAQDFIVKPFNNDQVAEKIKNILG